MKRADAIRHMSAGAEQEIRRGGMIYNKASPNHGKRMFRYRWTIGDSGKTGTDSCYVWDEHEARILLDRWNSPCTKGNWHHEPIDPIGCDGMRGA